MTLPACAGVNSPVNPSQPLRLCQGCALYTYQADGIKPAARRSGGDTWACANLISSNSSARESGILAGAGTDTSPAIFSSGD